MYSKLSLRNVKRSFSDYVIYFLTLTIGVCLFYTFNSITEQQIMLDVSENQKKLMNMLSDTLTYVSIFVSLILCFLILFANQFMIKRRKKEFGLYMTLGMGKRDISKILIAETSIIGILSLGTGLLLGGVVSQGMSILTASLFEVAITGYQFIFSVDAMVKTIVYFTIIFIVVMIMNTIVVARFSLIDLLNSMKKNEKIIVRNVKVTGILFVLSVVMIVGAYVLINYVGIGGNIVLFSTGIVVAVAGTLLFYFSGTSFVLTILQKNRKVYFKGLNLFVLRQINSKVNTSFLSITIISLMLFSTMSILTTGFSYKHSVENDLKKVAPYDASITVISMEDPSNDYLQELKEHKLSIDTIGKYVSFKYYNPDLLGEKLLEPYADGQIKKDIQKGFPMPVNAIKYSDYVKLMELQGITPYAIGENETIVLSNMNEAEHTIANFVRNHKSIEIGSDMFNIADKYHSVAIETENVGRTIASFVLPDKVAESLPVNRTIFNIQYDGNNEENDRELETIFHDFLDMENDRFAETPYYMRGVTKSMVYEQVAGETMTIIYIGIYLGIVFLISSAAVLALQQLSEASDSSQRYKTLKRIGVSQKQINKSIFTQILIYFMTPLSLALVHTIFTLYFVNKSIVYGSASSIILPASVSLVLFLLIYGGYLMATYTGYKRIVK